MHSNILYTLRKQKGLKNFAQNRLIVYIGSRTIMSWYIQVEKDCKTQATYHLYTCQSWVLYQNDDETCQGFGSHRVEVSSPISELIQALMWA